MGKITGSKIVFVESECVSGACNQIFTGGEYLGHFSANNTLMEGRGQLKRDAPQLIPFHGNFKLKKTATK